MVIRKWTNLDVENYAKDLFLHLWEECGQGKTKNESVEIKANIEVLKREIEAEKIILYGAVENNCFVGFLLAKKQGFREDENRIYIEQLWVHNYQEEIYSQLLSGIEQEAKSLNVTTIFLHRNVVDRERICFYEQKGFIKERIQMVKRIKKEEQFCISNYVYKAIAEDVIENLDIFASLYEENVVAHSFMEKFNYKDAIKKMNDLVNYLRQEKAIVYYACENGHIVGMVWAHPYENMSEKRMHISAVVVTKKYQSKAIGQQLYQALYKEMQEQKLEAVYTNVDAGNIPSLKFHYKQGFKEELVQMTKVL